MSSKSDVYSPRRSARAGKESSARKLKKTPKTSSTDSLGKSDSTELVLFNHSFNNPNYSIRSLDSSYSRGPSASGSVFDNTSRKGNASSESITDDPGSVCSGGSQKSKMSAFSRYFKNLSHSHGSIRTFSLKNTDETMDFNFEKFEPDSCSLQCAAVRLKLEDEGNPVNEIPIRSDLFHTDSIPKAIDVDSEGGDYVRHEKKSQSYVPFQKNENTIKGSSEIVTEPDRGRRPRNFWRKDSLLNKSKIMSFFAIEEKDEGTGDKIFATEEKNKEISEKIEPAREKYEPSVEKKRKKKKKKKDMVISYLDPPVPVEEDLEIKQHLKEIFFFLLQLICITIIAMRVVSPSMYYFTDLTTRVFFDSAFDVVTANDTFAEGERSPKKYQRKTLREASTIDDFWAFSENTLLQMLYWDFYTSKTDPSTHIRKSDKKMFHENQILGVARIRQVRVKENSCEIHVNVKRFFNDCLAMYSVFAEDTDPIKEGMENNDTATAWVFTEADKLQSTYSFGEFSVYGGGGYYLDLASDKMGAEIMLKELKENGWIGGPTRAVFITFNLYNANINLFLVCEILLEFPPLGGIIATPNFHSLNLLRYLNIMDFLVLGFEFTYVVFVVYSTICEIREINKQRTSYLFFWWNILNFIKLLLQYLYVIMGIVRKISAAHLVFQVDTNPQKYTEFQHIKRIQITYNNILALLLFLSWVKLFTYLNLTKTMMQFKKTLSKSLKAMAQFFPMFITIFVAFSFLGFLLFGYRLKCYSTVSHSFLTLLQALLGEFNYAPIVETHPIMGPIFYVAFIVFMLFVLLNVFIAIIVDSYMTVRAQIIPESPKVLQYLKRACVNFFTCWRPIKKRKYRKITRKRILFDDIKKALKRAGFKDEEISIFFHKYNINFRNFLDDKTKTRIMRDVELNSINFTETAEQFQIDTLRRRLDEFRERMENWEAKLQPVIDKVDVLIHRF